MIAGSAALDHVKHLNVPGFGNPAHGHPEGAATSHEVRVNRIEAWLCSGGRSPHEQAMQGRLRSCWSDDRNGFCHWPVIRAESRSIDGEYCSGTTRPCAWGYISAKLVDLEKHLFCRRDADDLAAGVVLVNGDFAMARA